jgi:lipoyl(octanoyl) transferase
MTLVLNRVVTRRLGQLPYERALEDMRAFTARRSESSADELWLLEHPPVYTLGQGAQARSITNDIPVVKSDRGGDITYHGPGQVVLYTLVDLARRGIKVKRFVWLLEQCVIDVLGGLLPDAAGGRVSRRPGAPGVYVDGAKVAALGIRVARGRAYHGLALNVDTDLAPFAAIDPCGYPGLAVTRTKDLSIGKTKEELADRLAENLITRLEHA